MAFTGSMGWLARRGPFSAALIGAAAGVLAYRAGASLGVLAIRGTPGSYFAIALGWALALSILAAAARGLSAPEVRDGARPDASHW